MHKDDEQILVIKSDILFKDGRWQGLKTDNLDYYIDLINKNYQFKRRGDMENDPSWQQVIPYIVFNFENKYFIYKYLPKAGEKRLVDTYQIGIGGHINNQDANSSQNVLEAGMEREWAEEVNFSGSIVEKKFIGLLKDDNMPVEKLHVGMVYNFTGDSPDISIKETDKMEGKLVDINDIAEYIKNNQGVWVKIFYKEYLSKI